MRRLMFSILLGVMCFALWAETPRRVIPDLAIIHKDSSALVMYGARTGFDKLFTKMDRLISNDEGKVNIVHMGGSHVEAGVLTEQLRTNLMRMRDGKTYLDGGLGHVFPFVVAKTNTPMGYTSHREGVWTSFKNNKALQDGQSLGLSGIAVQTTDLKAQAGLVARERMGNPNPPRTVFSKVRVMGYSTSGVYPKLSTVDSTYVPDNLGPDGKSLGDSVWTYTLASETDSIVLSPSAKGRLTITGMLCENDRPGFVVSPIGINGASLVSYARCNDFMRDLSMNVPDMVIFGIGINDASGDNFDAEVFIRRYLTLCNQIRDLNPDCAFLFITNNDSCRRIKKKYVNNPNAVIVREAFHSLAKRYDAAVWDLFGVMGGLESIFEWEKEGLAKKDKIHFTDQGYKILGDMLYNAIAEQYDAYIEGGLG